jgi:hypothetical protein
MLLTAMSRSQIMEVSKLAMPGNLTAVHHDAGGYSRLPDHELQCTYLESFSGVD